MSVRVRRAEPRDAARIADLLDQLGYPSEAASIPGRLERMAKERLTIAVVAELGGDVAGLAAGQVFDAIHADGPAAWLMALVVDERARGSGVGRALVDHVADWARRHGAAKLSVPTHTRREAAHRFYEHLGFERNGYRYTRSLP